MDDYNDLNNREEEETTSDTERIQSVLAELEEGLNSAPDGAGEAPETTAAGQQDRPDTAYPYGGAYPGTETPGYPYGAPAPQQPQPPVQGGYPYGSPASPQPPAQSGYPYGAPVSRQPEPSAQGGYPYGSPAEKQPEPPAQSVYPYGDGNTYSNGYPMRQPEKDYAYEDAGETEKPRSGMGSRIFIIIAVAILVLVLGLIAYGIATKAFSGEKKKEEVSAGAIDNVESFVTETTPETQKAKSAGDVLSPNEIYKKVLNSSVGVLVYGSGKKLISEGSGVIFKEDNDATYTYIVTCAHVISDKGTSIMIQTADEKEYKADVVGYDNKTDIGVVRIKANGLQAAEFGDSEKLSVGNTVYAIGNPGGTEFANSFTNGMISAIDRPVSSSSTGYTMECIQHTAAINPGNSGGALINEYGQVIGINSMKIVSDEYEGMGFSVPSSVFVKVVNEIVANGYVTNRPKIGITYLPASSEQAYAMFVAIKGLPSGSIIVYSIADDSSLANSKLKKGDLIVGVNGEDLKNTSDLAEMVENGKVGDKLTLNIVRINSDYTYEEFDVEATLVEDKGDTNLLEEEDTTSYFDDYFGDDYGDDYGDEYGDDYDDFFDDFFGNP